VIAQERHPDVEYIVSIGPTERVFNTFDEAVSYAFAAGLSVDKVVIDVLIYSEDGARAFGGDQAVAEYQVDPDASVAQRFEMTVKDHGRVP